MDHSEATRSRASRVVAPPKGMAAAATRRSWTGVLDVALPGFYAWGATVAIPLLQTDGALAAWGTGLASLFVLGLACSSAYREAGAASTVRGLAFIGFAAATWVLLGRERLEVLDPLEAALGGVGWMLCALGWGSLRNRKLVPEENLPAVQAAPPLVAREHLPKRAALYLALAVAAAVALIASAWTIERTAVSALGHLGAVIVGCAVLIAGGRLSLFPGHSVAWSSPRSRLMAASRPLALVAFLALLALLAQIIR